MGEAIGGGLKALSLKENTCKTKNLNLNQRLPNPKRPSPRKPKNPKRKSRKPQNPKRKLQNKAVLASSAHLVRSAKAIVLLGKAVQEASERTNRAASAVKAATAGREAIEAHGTTEAHAKAAAPAAIAEDAPSKVLPKSSSKN
jgi:hypothetical protein